MYLENLAVKTMSSTISVFKILFKERYKDPTLQLMLPTILIGNIFIPAFLEKGGFQTYALVVAFIPIISLSETVAFALALRNIIFVLGDHLTSGSIVSFLMMPIKRRTFFLMSYFLDVILPYLMWLIINVFYLMDIGYWNFMTQILTASFTAGYFFSTNVILFLTLTIRSNGATTLASMFILGSIFIVGGFGNYSLLSTNPSVLSITSFLNPYPLLLAYAISSNATYLGYAMSGVLIDFILAVILLIISFLIMLRMEV
ncbi:hypothetical protein SJAV_08330 [Sulfurisphaera javensis]|uniref:ABC transporter permease n=2 Tax=Sulfurisphaera javensis TaxID=2049879 RepID=A0AAT9GPY7_9CREN